MTEAVWRFEAEFYRRLQEEAARRGANAKPEPAPRLEELERELLDLQAKNAELEALARAARSLLEEVERELHGLRAKNAGQARRTSVEITRVPSSSDETEIHFATIVKGLGGDYVEALPLPPGKVIRFEHPSLPGFQPTTIALEVSFANNSMNLSDLELQFFFTSVNLQHGMPCGPRFRGNDFLDKRGKRVRIPWPMYLSKPLRVGTLERLAVEIKHGGQLHDVNSICVTIFLKAESAWHSQRS